MNKKKKILFILPVFKEGGAEKTISAILVGLIKRGYEVHMIILKDKVSLAIPEGVIHYVIENQLIIKLPEFLKKFFVNFNLKKIVDIINPSTIFTSLPRAHKAVARTFGNKENIYYIFHNTPSPSLSHKQYSRKVGIARLRSIYNGKKLITLSEGIKEDIINNIGIEANDIKVINNPFDFKNIKKSAEEKINIPYDDYLINVSHFYKRKRHDVLIKAYKESGCTYPLLLLGERGEKEKVNKMVREENLEEKVIFVGWQHNPYPYIKNARLLLLTSDEEGMPRAIVESLILKTPVVSTDCPSGPNEILTDQLSHYLSAVGDSKSMATRISEALEHYPDIEARYVQRFRQEMVVEQYIDLIESASGEK